MSAPKVIGASVSPDERTVTVIYDEPIGDRFDNGLTIIADDDTIRQAKLHAVATVVVLVLCLIVMTEIVMVVSGPAAAYWAVPLVFLPGTAASVAVAWRQF